MIKKTVVATLGALVVAGAAHAAMNTQAQIQNLQNQINQLQSSKGGAVSGLVTMNPALSNMMLSQQAGVNKELALLNARKMGKVANGLTIGGDIQADVVYQHRNNTSNAFINPSMSSISTTSKSASRINLTNIDLQFVAAINSWATAYVNYENIYDGSNLTNLFNKAYVLIGNLNSSPVYGLVGRNDINFGQFASVNPYSMPLNRVVFQANGAVAEVGYNDYGFDAAVSAMNGGTQNGTVYSSNWALNQNLNTVSNNNQINNYAFNAGYGMTMQNGFGFHVGAGYLAGTRFTEATTGKTAGAYDLNAKVNFANFELLGEFTSTVKKIANNADGMAYQAAAAYSFPVMGHKTTASVGYSALNKGISGWNGTDNQVVVGLRSNVVKNVSTGLEYAYNKDSSSAKYSTVTLDVTAMF